jgi:SAM-dependent methyltransferase
MPLQDAERWNERYLQDKRYATFTGPRPFLVKNAHFLPTKGLALDVAMGLGGNAALLLERGLRVIGIDVSSVAVSTAKKRLPALMAVVADLADFHLPEARIDVILNFYYLQRDLWSQYQSALRPGGLLVIETLTHEMLRLHPETNPDYLLEPGELRQAFSEMEILVYREGWEESRVGQPQAVASLVARKS